MMLWVCALSLGFQLEVQAKPSPKLSILGFWVKGLRDEGVSWFRFGVKGLGFRA